MPGPYSAGRVFVQVVPSFRGLQQTLRKAFNDAGDQASKDFSDSFEKGSKGGLFTPQAQNEINKAADKSGEDAAEKLSGAFQRTLSRRLKTTGESLGKGISPELDRIRAQVDALDKTVKIGMDAKTVYAELSAIEARLSKIDNKDLDITVEAHFNQAKAKTEAKAMLLDIQRSLGDAIIQVRPELRVERMQGQLERSIRAAVKSALNDIPDVKLDLDSSEATRKIAELRAELMTLDATDPDVDFDSAAAMKKIGELKFALRDLSKESANVQVRADTAAAALKLVALERQVKALDGKTINIEVDDHGGLRRFADSIRDSGASMRSFSLILLTVVTIGAALIPILAALAAGFLALLGAIPALVAGLGVLVLAFSGIGDAVSALGDVEKNAAKDAQAAADTMRNAAKSVKDAEIGLQRAREAAAQGAEDAARRVADAQRSLVYAQENASRAIESALARQADAERRLADAQRDAQDAQEDLIEAREQAEDNIEDLGLAVKQNAIDEKQAVIDLFEANRAAAATLADPGATNKEKEEARLRLEQAQLTLEKIRLEQERLREEKKKADEEGIEGSELVQTAQERLIEALQDEVDAQREVGEAADDVSRARIDAARMVEDAERGVTDAIAAQQRQIVDGNRSVEAAQSRLTDAEADYQDALYETSVVGSASRQKLEEAFAAIGPAGEAFAIFLFGLRDTFREIRDLAQEGMLPGVQEFMETILRENGPIFLEFVRDMSQALGDLFVQAGETFTDPTWQRFFEMLTDFGPGFIEKFGQIGLDILTFFAGLGTALAPFSDMFADVLVGLSGRLADFGSGLFESEGFQKFLDFLAQFGPVVTKALVALFLALANLFVALAPVGEQILGALTLFFQVIAAIPPDILRTLVVGIIAFIGVVQLLAGLGVVISALGTAIEVIFFLMALPFGTIALAIGAVVVALLAFWVSSETFRDIVMGAIHAVGDAFVWLWEVIEPVVNDIAAAWLWLWETVLEPVFNFIWEAIKLLGDILWDVWSGFLWPVIQLLAAAFFWLWGEVIEGVIAKITGAWTLLFEGMKWAWENVLHPVFLEIEKALNWLRDNVFDPILKGIGELWDGLVELVKKPINFIVDTIINHGIIGGFNWLADKLGTPHLNEIPWPPSGWNGTPVPPGHGGVQAAMGGLIPGWSPSDRADNIPAWLTAGEYVLPVGAVRRLKRDYGLEFLEQLRGYATGGMVFPLPKGSYVQGRGFSAGHSGVDLPVPMNTRVMSVLSGVVELVKYLTTSYGKHVMIDHGNGIHSLYAHLNSIGVQQGATVSAGQIIGYSDSTGNSTGPHLHFEIRTPTGAYADAVDPFKFLLGEMAEGVLEGGFDPVGWLKDRVEDLFAGVGDSEIGEILLGIPKKLLGAALGAVGDMFANIVDFVAGDSLSDAVNREIVNAVAQQYGWGSGAEWNALQEIVNRESGWDNNAQNPTSTAFGLFQFLDGTWPTVGAVKTSDPHAQAVAGLRYIKDRYGDPTDALAFHNAHGWYSEGGLVPANLYDSGGIIPPGLSMVVNRTGANEHAVVMTPEQFSDGGGNTVYDVDINGYQRSANEIISELVWETKRARRGGVVMRGGRK